MGSQNNINNEIPNNNFLVQRTDAGVPAKVTISHTANTASSNATLKLSTDALLFANPAIAYRVGTGDRWSTGSRQDSGSVYLTTYGPFTFGTENSRANTTGQLQYQNQPRSALNRSTTVGNITGNGASYTVLFNGGIGFSYNAGTGVSTATKTGAYLVCGFITFTNLTVANTSGKIFIPTSGGATYTSANSNFGLIMNAANTLTMPFSFILYLTAAETFTVQVQVSGGAGNTVGVGGGGANPITYLGGFLLG